MDLFEESLLEQNRNNDEKSKKTARLILIIIGILLLLTIGLVGTIVYLKQSTLVVSLDGKSNDTIKNMLLFDENSSQVYVPIKDIASYLGYEAFNGNYSNLSEDASQCYVQCENEVAVFTLNSDKVYKIMPKVTSDYEYFDIDEPVIAKNGKLYTTMDGIEKAFNTSFTYDVQNKKIQIFTMPYLISFYSNYILDYGYAEISEDFNNQKAVLNDMLVVKTAAQNAKYAVIKADTGEAILEAKYEDINYLQHSSDFFVKNNGKVGIISSSRDTKVQLIYDTIKMIDYKADLYEVSKDGKYGIIDIEGNIKLHLDYDEIGLDISKFQVNDLKSGYIILNTLIPVKQNELWGLVDLNGKIIVEPKYDELGYIASSSSTVNNLLVIPDYDMIVVGKDEKYSLITVQGKEVVAFVLDEVYISKSGGKTQYYMSWNNQTREATEVLDKMGYGTKKNTVTNNNDTTNTNSTNTTTNEIDSSNTVTNEIETNEVANNEVDNQNDETFE